MITSRDKVALDFITNFKMVTPKQVDKEVYNNLKVCYNRLNRLHDDKWLYKVENTVSKGFIYSTERIRTLKQFMHCYIRTEFYFALKEASDVYHVDVEQRFGSIKPDLLISCIYNDLPYHFFIEVETNANHSTINYKKYQEFFYREWRDYFNMKPTVVYVTDKKISADKINFEYRHIKTNLSNLMDIFK